MNSDEPEMPQHLHLHCPTTSVLTPAGRNVTARFESLASAEDLAPLMLAAYPGTPDDEGETLEDTVEVLRSAKSGGLGPWLPEASFVAIDQADRPIGAIVTCKEEDDTPFIAFVFTDPGHTGRGIATTLITHVCGVLSALNYPDIRLWVSANNDRALRLYRRLGFTTTES